MSPYLQSHENLLACLEAVGSFGRLRAREIGLLAWPTAYPERESLTTELTLTALAYGRVKTPCGERALCEEVLELSPALPSATLASLLNWHAFSAPTARESRALVSPETGLPATASTPVRVAEAVWLQARTVAVEAVDNALLARVYRPLKRAVDAGLLLQEREGNLLPYYVLTTKGARFLAASGHVAVAPTVGCGDERLTHKAVAETYLIHQARENVPGRAVLNEFAMGRDKARLSPQGACVDLPMSAFRQAFNREPDGVVANVETRTVEVVEAENAGKAQSEFVAAMGCVAGSGLHRLSGFEITKLTFVRPNNRNQRTLGLAARSVYLGESGGVQFAGRTKTHGAAQVDEFGAFLDRMQVADVRLSSRRFIPLGVLRVIGLRAFLGEVGPLDDLLAGRRAWA